MSFHNKKALMGWCLFDFANSTYSAVIVAVVFPVYYTTQIVTDGTGDMWWGRAISLSMLIVALISPVLGGIADYSGMRKRFLAAFTLMSITAIASLGQLEGGMVMTGFALIVIANVGMEGGLVFYNAYLTDIVDESHQGRASAWGFAVGYAGSIAALLIALPLVRAGMFSVTWLSVAIMFGIFSLPAFFWLPRDIKRQNIIGSSAKSLSYTLDTLRQLLRDKSCRLFLASYFLYADGVSTIIVFSSIFASATLGFSTGELIILYISVQVAALAGAYVMAAPTDRWGPKRVVMLSLVLWIVVCVASFFVEAKGTYWAIAIVAGLGLGTVQAASRALYARLIPKGHESEYFGVYTLAGKTSAVLGPLLFGYISVAFGSQRPAVLSVSLFFVAGLILLSRLRAGQRLPDST